jgi:hypothetical protein
MSATLYTGPKYRFGRIFNKHLILELFAYANSDSVSLVKLFFTARNFRRLIIENFFITKGILVQDHPVKVHFGSLHTRNELSLLNFSIAVSKLELLISNRE